MFHYFGVIFIIWNLEETQILLEYMLTRLSSDFVTACIVVRQFNNYLLSDMYIHIKSIYVKKKLVNIPVGY